MPAPSGFRPKIINDPVHGFIRIGSPLILQVLDHRYFQRMRHIRQTGAAEWVYPGAVHTRFQHALGAMHLMQQALNTLIEKGHSLSDLEYEAAQIAVLLHDLGHSPFSHALEFKLFPGIHHEMLTAQLMHAINLDLGGQLSLAISIYQGNYPRNFLHQLVSSQLDMDRMDYLKRDCFFTGVVEGEIASDRIIRMLDVYRDQLVLEAKAAYSIENFLTARRFMYWQVYYHKTTVSAEAMLVRAWQRAQWLHQQSTEVYTTPALQPFLSQQVKSDDYKDPMWLQAYASLSDHDIWVSLMQWQHHEDKVLQLLSGGLVNRRLFKINYSKEPVVSPQQLAFQKLIVENHTGITGEDLDWLVFSDEIDITAYHKGDEDILIKQKDGSVVSFAEIGDEHYMHAIGQPVHRYYMCYYKPEAGS